MTRKRYNHRTPIKRQEEIREILESKGVRLTPCQHCRHTQITIFEISFRIGVRTEFRNRPGRFFSAAAVICENCGFKSEFDGEALGLDKIGTNAFG